MAEGEPSEDVPMGSGVRLDYLGEVRIHRSWQTTVSESHRITLLTESDAAAYRY